MGLFLLGPEKVGSKITRVDAQAKRRATRLRHAVAETAWDPSTQPDWLTEEFYAQKIQPLLRGVTNSQIATLLGVSKPYASAMRAGRRRPHPRHWQALAELVNAPNKDPGK